MDGIKSILESNAGIILCNKNLEGLIYPLYNRNNINQDIQQLLVFVDNPRLVFMRLANKIKSSQGSKTTTGISNRAIISDSAKIGNNCYIGEFTTVGEECIIGDNTIIGSRVMLKKCTIGNNCSIQSGCVIGEDGFAFERVTDTE